MYYFLLTLLIVDGLLLAVVVLLQAGQGGGLAAMGGGTTDFVVGGRQATTLLTKATWVCGGLFLFLALVISLVTPSRGGAGSEVLERLRQGQQAAPAPSSLPIEAVPAAPADSGAAKAPAPAQ